MKPDDWPARAIARLVGLLLAVTLVGSAVFSAARAGDPVVHAVLFYSPSCGHCEKVISVDLPPLFERYGGRLQVVGIDVTQPAGQELYAAAVERFDLSDRLGVPLLIVGDTALVGSIEIPEQLPGLVDTYLETGGVGWPDVPGIAAVMPTEVPAPAGSPAVPAASPAGSPASASPAPAAATAPPATASAAPAGPLVPDRATAPPAAGPVDRLAADPIASALAIIVLVVMLSVLGWALVAAWHAGADLVARPPSPIVAVLAVAGLGVALYLAYVESADVAAVCGPVGDCNAVQQSSFARLFGVLPIGVLGSVGYAGILVAWLAGRVSDPRVAKPARVALVAASLAGTAFSIYLTFLEPFVIGAVCAWCLSSAVVMTLVLVGSFRSMTEPRPTRRVAASSP